ncbi:hypothetical protein SBA1_290067 [Candidatus Sulfotelmatobacter kueseliae]|uniref:Uncharacterized protein n=1 Tax=Candidatus Sulfotelmatobacter kueseliae TaxID=2042962 RepID=A0A2U3KJ76_9BACT|nr:hypothetical protein SBA1_290067 [Candidatus Sulfotelmatobacter kueseliae]
MASSSHLLLFPLALALAFPLGERFLKGRRFTGTWLQESLYLVQNAFNWRQDELAILLPPHGSDALFQSETPTEFRRDDNLPLRADYNLVSHGSFNLTTADHVRQLQYRLTRSYEYCPRGREAGWALSFLLSKVLKTLE